MMKLRERMSNLQKELTERKKDLQNKIDKDTANYGRPLGNTVLQKRIETTKKKIAIQQKRIIKEQDRILSVKVNKFKLSNYDQKVLNSIRNNHEKTTTNSENSYRYNHKYSGSSRSRWEAKQYHRSVRE